MISKSMAVRLQNGFCFVFVFFFFFFESLDQLILNQNAI